MEDELHFWMGELGKNWAKWDFQRRQGGRDFFPLKAKMLKEKRDPPVPKRFRTGRDSL